MPTPERIEYAVWVNGECKLKTNDLETAIRTWDGQPENFRRKPDQPLSGGISVQIFHVGLMVRDGWILHLMDDSQVYLSPNLKEN